MQTALSPQDYDRFWSGADDYIRYNPGSRHRRRLVLDMLQDLPFASVLDIGCGNGALLRLLRGRFPRVRALHGADLSPAVIDESRRRHPEMSFSVLNIEKEHLPGTFDLITCCEVIEHLSDQQAALRNIAAMLPERGYALITCPTGKVYDTDRHFGHVHHPSATELAELAGDAGLQVVQLRNWGWPLMQGFKQAANLNPAWALRRFASGRYTAASRLVAAALYYLNFLNRDDPARGCQLLALLRR
jgi:trans-aconitate methyltransferase